MTNILDAVEPDAFLATSDDGECHLGFDKQDLYREVLRVYTMQPLYSRETVESLLEAHRKQVLLEVIAKAEKNILPAISTYELLRMVNGEK
jgi:RNA binding exosome subunit